jgi:hypothetical protein
MPDVGGLAHAVCCCGLITQRLGLQVVHNPAPLLLVPLQWCKGDWAASDRDQRIIAIVRAFSCKAALQDLTMLFWGKLFGSRLLSAVKSTGSCCNAQELLDWGPSTRLHRLQSHSIPKTMGMTMAAAAWVKLRSALPVKWRHAQCPCIIGHN